MQAKKTLIPKYYIYYNLRDESYSRGTTLVIEVKPSTTSYAVTWQTPMPTNRSTSELESCFN